MSSHGEKKNSSLTSGGSYWDSSLKIILNLIQEKSEDNYEFSSAEKHVLNTHTCWTPQFYGEKMQAFSLL